MDIVTALEQELSVDEGRRKMPYKDQFGNITIGVGRNLSANGVSDATIDLMLKEDIQTAMIGARKVFKNLDSFSQNRQTVIISMVFNMGLSRFEQFHNFIACATSQNWPGASAELVNSLWAKQVPNRAKKYEQMLEQG